MTAVSKSSVPTPAVSFRKAATEGTASPAASINRTGSQRSSVVRTAPTRGTTNIERSRSSPNLSDIDRTVSSSEEVSRGGRAC